MASIFCLGEKIITKTHQNESILSPDLNRIPTNLRVVHLMGICGTGMAALAGILKEQGYLVRGSDQNVYPPMSHLLAQLSIHVLKGYDPNHLHPSPDLVIVGNVITRKNPEAIELSRLKIPYVSLPQALMHFAIKGKKSIVISGTHGKTTTSALAAWVLEKAGMEPGFMIGGIPLNFGVSFRLGKGPYFIVEGDEYDTAFFDKGPKFLHYAPQIVILTSIEFDHADIYQDLDHVLRSFRKLIEIIPREGLLIANGDDPRVISLGEEAKCPVITYSLSGNGRWNAIDISIPGESTYLRVLDSGKVVSALSTSLFGRYNISNLLSVVALSDSLGISRESLSQSVDGFTGVKRRQEILGEKRGILVLDDFAHHPTAVRETIQAIKARYPDRRLIAVFEPRSNSSRRNVFQERYAMSFEQADLVMIPEPPLMTNIPPSDRFSSPRLVEDLNRAGIEAFYYSTTDRLLDALLTKAETGDVILFMSNGAFDNVQGRLLERL